MRSLSKFMIFAATIVDESPSPLMGGGSPQISMNPSLEPVTNPFPSGKKIAHST